MKVHGVFREWQGTRGLELQEQAQGDQCGKISRSFVGRGQDTRPKSWDFILRVSSLNSGHTLVSLEEDFKNRNPRTVKSES